MFLVFLRNTQHTDGFMETAGFMAESVEKIFHLAEQVSQVLVSSNSVNQSYLLNKLCTFFLRKYILDLYTCTPMYNTMQ